MHARKGHAGPGSHRALTLVEVLVVIGIIILLVTLLIVALAAGSNMAASARTQTLMVTMSQGLTQFERDFNKKPPVLARNRDVIGAPAAGDFPGLQNWWSLTTPAEYLLGYGSASQDGAGGLGLRDPGVDGAWNCTVPPGTGALGERAAVTSGKVYGPYIQLEDNQFIAKLDDNNTPNNPNDDRVVYPNDGAYAQLDKPIILVDYWGEPIRYYRRHPLRPNQTNQPMNLGDVVALRPFTIDGSEDATSPFADASGDAGTTLALKSAQFALFSFGPDLIANEQYRFDDPDGGANTEHNNRDNLVEIGQ